MTETKRPLKVFLCHAHSDRNAVRALYNRLTKDGVKAWLDKENLLPGQDWELEIRKAVREADVVVVCLSKQFNQAGFRQKEVRLALDTAMEKPEGEIFIIPARLEECDNLESLRKWHWVDLFEDDGYERLIQALQAHAYKIDATLQVKRKRKKEEPIGYSRQRRVLEAAIEEQVRVGVSTSLFVWVKRRDSKSIISVVSSIDEDIVLDKDNVKSKGLEIEFPIENGRVLPIGISLRLVAQEFSPSIQQKQITVPPEGDSEVCTFIITPNRAGKLLLNLEVLKDHVSIATRSIHTTAIESEKKEHSSMVLMSIPIIVYVQPKSTGKSVGGEISDSVVVSETGNVINVGEQEKSASEKPQPKKTKLPRKPNTAIIVALIGLAGTVIAALLSSPLIEKWFSPVATPTESAIATVSQTQPPSTMFTPLSSMATNTPTLTLEPTSTTTVTQIPTPVVIMDHNVPMILIPAGFFQMHDKQGAVKTYVNAFYIDQHEVTNAQYEQCADAKVCFKPHKDVKAQYRNVLHYDDHKYDNFPVVLVDWNMTLDYCRWRGKYTRLPTSAEWEKAARGLLVGQPYPWGEDAPTCNEGTVNGANFSQCGSNDAFPVMQFAPNGYGLYDMFGNVAEWVSDFDALGIQRLIRGGSWLNDSSHIKVESESTGDSNQGYVDTGFRCARDANP